jgi:hypothetical protein
VERDFKNVSCHELSLLHACLWTNVGSFSSPGWAGFWEYFLSLHARKITPYALNQLFSFPSAHTKELEMVANSAEYR